MLTTHQCALRTATEEGTKGLSIDRRGRAITKLECFDAKFVVQSNDDSVTAEDSALGYKQQQPVDEAWRTLKSGRRMRVAFHGAP